MDRIDVLRIFKRVAETKSFSGVARELEVTQPTVSKAIQSLEKEFGVTLLRRTTRGLSLTTEGQKLYNSGGPLLDHFEQVVSEVKNQKLHLSGDIRISASLAFARLILSPTFKEFSELHPHLRFHFILSDGYLDLVENNVDVAIRIGDLEDSQLKAIKIGISRRSLYVSKAYLKTFGTPKNIEDLKSHRLLYYTRLGDRPMWPLHSKAGVQEPFFFEPFFRTDGSDLMRQAVLDGLGIALMPTWMMIEPEKNKEVVRLFPENSESPDSVFAVTASTTGLTAKQRTLIEFFRKKFDGKKELSLRSLAVEK